MHDRQSNYNHIVEFTMKVRLGAGVAGQAVRCWAGG